MMSTFVYPSFKIENGNGTIVLPTDPLYIMLVTDSYTPLAGHSKRSDVTNEPAASGTYAIGGTQLMGVTWALSGNNAKLDANDVQWTGTTLLNIRGCVIYKRHAGVASTEELLMALKFTGTDPLSSTAGTFNVQFPVGGIALKS